MSTQIEVASYKGKRGTHSIWWKVLLALAAAGAIVFAALLGWSLASAHDDVKGEPGVMVVLGCQVKPWGPSTLLQDRLDKALEYYVAHPEITVVMSGGQGPDEPSTEARAMADFFIAQGVPEEQMILETMSHNTNQNLRYTMEHLKQAKIDLSGGVVIVSSGWHLARVRMLASRAGYGEVSTLAAPSSHLPSRLKMYIREPVGLVKSFVLDW